jgi:hypothetical protein
MTRLPAVFALLATGLLFHATGSAAPDWSQVKAGMSGDEAAKALGPPLLRTTARGFEVWVYDGRGEIVFRDGPLQAWTKGAPTPESLARPVDRDVLMHPVRRVAARRLTPTQSLPARTYQEISTTHFRYLPQ